MIGEGGTGDPGDGVRIGGAVARIVSVGLAAILALGPVAWWPRDPYGLIKNVVVEGGAFALAGVWIAAVIGRGEIRWKRSPVTIAIVAFLSWACLSFFFAPFRGYGAPRLRELFAYLLVYLLALNVCGGEREGRLICTGALAGLAAASLTGLAQYFQILPTRWETSPWGTGLGARVYGTMLNPNILAGHIAAVFPLGLALFLLRWRSLGRLVGGALLLVSFGCLLLTVSWGGYAAFVAGCALAAVLALRASSGGRSIGAGGTIRLLAMMGALALLFFHFQGRGTIADTSGMKARFLLWRASGGAIAGRPLAGHGPGNTPPAIGERLTRLVMAGKRENPDGEEWRGSYRVRFLDGDYFGEAVEFGLVGLALFVGMFAAAFGELRRAAGKRPGVFPLCTLAGAAGCAAAVLAQSVVSYPMRVAPTAAVFFALLGVAAAAARPQACLSLSKASLKVRIAIAAIPVFYAVLLIAHAVATLHGEVLLVRAYEAARAGRWREAAGASARAVRCPVTDPEAYGILGDALLTLGRPAEAERAFAALARFDPSRPEAYDRLAAIYEKRGDRGLALANARRAVSLERHDTPQFRLHLARLLEKRGRGEEAKRILLEGMAIYPRSGALRAAAAYPGKPGRTR